MMMKNDNNNTNNDHNDKNYNNKINDNYNDYNSDDKQLQTGIWSHLQTNDHLSWSLSSS